MGAVTDTCQTDVAAPTAGHPQQQTAMLQVQAECMRLPRLRVERLLEVYRRLGGPRRSSLNWTCDFSPEANWGASRLDSSCWCLAPTAGR